MANDKKNVNIHSGHRKRMMNRYIEEGLNVFREHEVLEMLLYLAYPQMNTNDKAHMLLKKFGNLDNVLNASIEELLLDVSDEGVGDKRKDSSLTPRAAAIISMIRDIDKYAKSQAAKLHKGTPVLSDVYDVGRFCCEHFGKGPIETLYMIILDSTSKYKNAIRISEGNVRNTAVDLEKIIVHAIQNKACGVILCHNHPGGNMDISNADKAATDKVAASLATLGINLVDHIVCCEDKFESMRQRGMILY